MRLTTIAVALCAALGMALPSFAAAGSIAGTVSADGGGPIQGVEVCTRSEPFSFESPCAQTNAGGAYKIDGLPDANYHVAFFTYVGDLNYVPESYNDKPLNLAGGDLVAVSGDANVTGIDAELEEGGVIEGMAEDASTSGPAVGVEVCATRSFPAEYYEECAITRADGTYAVNALKTGEYTVRFDGGNDANYLKRWYDEAEFSGSATKVPVTAGASPVTEIDVSLSPGGQILGRVTDAETGAPLKGMDVCLWDDIHGFEEYFDTCVLTDAAGNYAFRSLEASTYKVAFSSYQDLGAEYPEQWWNGKLTRAEATPIVLAPPQTVSGIDAQLLNRIEKPKPDPIQVTIIPRYESPKPPPKKCRKGFHKKKVKGGKKKCVRKHKRHGKGKAKGRGGASRASR